MTKLLTAAILGLTLVSASVSADQGTCDIIESVWTDGELLFDLRKTVNGEANGNKYKAYIPGMGGTVRLTCDLTHITEDGVTGYTETSNCTAKSPGAPAYPFPITLNYNFEVVDNELLLDPLYLPAEVPPFVLQCVK
jgi:hypothetical protein